MAIKRGKKLKQIIKSPAEKAIPTDHFMQLRKHLKPLTDTRSVLIELLMATGCRLEECCRIDGLDIERALKSQNNELYISPCKGSCDRWVPVPERILLKANALMNGVPENKPLAWTMNQNDDDTIIQINTSKKTRAVHSWCVSIYNEFNRIQKKLFGEALYSPHQIRHTFCMIALEKSGNNVPMVQKMMGHKQITNTARYLVSHDTTEAFLKIKKMLD